MCNINSLDHILTLNSTPVKMSFYTNNYVFWSITKTSEDHFFDPGFKMAQMCWYDLWLCLINPVHYCQCLYNIVLICYIAPLVRISLGLSHDEIFNPTKSPFFLSKIWLQFSYSEIRNVTSLFKYDLTTHSLRKAAISVQCCELMMQNRNLILCQCLCVSLCRCWMGHRIKHKHQKYTF
jgi:hypothetical protein